MRFRVEYELLARAGKALSRMSRLRWIVGGAGSGKTTVCRLLGSRHGLAVVDMDAHIYGDYHSRFTDARHPANRAWSTAPNGLQWLLSMSWEEFDAFNRAAVPEYLDLLAEDLRMVDPGAALLVDGGICNPALLAQAMPVERILCVAAEGSQSERVWEQTDERLSMKEAVFQLRNPEEAWRRFLEFDTRITAMMLQESRAAGICVLDRTHSESADAFAERVAEALGI